MPQTQFSFSRHKLRHYRRNVGLSQHQLSLRLGLTHHTISSWEAGRWQPSIGNLIPLATALGVAVEDLFEESR